MGKSSLFLVILLTINLLLPVHAQEFSPPQTELAERLNSLAKNASPELAYIQTSKDIYETGEDLWFKVYLLNSRTLSPSELSKTLYLQLVKEDTKKTVWQEKYEIEEGFSNGRILLKEDMDEGNYLIEAFTANSFFADSSEFTAIRKVKVVKDITHLRQIKAEFDKRYYGSTDSIKVKLLPVFQKDTSEIDITATLKLSGDVQGVFQTTMKLNEEKELSFKPQSPGKGSQVIINSKYHDHSEEVILPIPCRTNPIQFNVFPEGGTIISGIKSRVAFKAVNINGEPINVNGTLYKDDSLELEFSSMHDGMGSFYFMPVKNAKYYIRLKESLTDSIYSFPQIEPEGLTLRLLSRDKDYLNFLISKNLNGQFENIYLMVQIRGIIYGLTESKLDKDLKIKVPLADMPQGIAEVTLFNDKMMPVAERLVYVNPEKKIKIQTILTDSIFQTRGKVNLKIITRDEKNNPIKANLGLTVFDKIYENQSDSINILTHIYLSTQLKGRIYNPGYYFNEKNPDREYDLDLLLITQGWRKYIWNEANLNTSSSNNEVVSDGINGYSHLAFGRKRAPRSQVSILAFSPEKDSVKKVILVDSEGSFRVNPYLLKNWEGQYIYLKPISSSNEKINLEFINPFDSINHVLNSKSISTPLCSPFREMKIPEPKITKEGAIFIKDVVIKGNRKGVIRGKYFGTLDSIAKFTLDINTDYVCRYNVLNCQLHPRESDNRKPIEGEIVWFAPDDYHAEYQIVYHRKPSKVTRTEEELLRLFNLFRIRAYYVKHEYYQPNYDKDYEIISIPDYRNTLMWAPSIETNNQGEAIVSFFCSDINTDFVGRIEGVGGEGLIGAGCFKFTVRKLQPIP
jgi:hypothetical protein